MVICIQKLNFLQICPIEFRYGVTVGNWSVTAASPSSYPKHDFLICDGVWSVIPAF